MSPTTTTNTITNNTTTTTTNTTNTNTKTTAALAHRDLKPANALLSSAADADARVKISDFGLARQAFAGDEALGFSTRLGTVAYAAPELLDSQAQRDGATCERDRPRGARARFARMCPRRARARARSLPQV